MWTRRSALSGAAALVACAPARNDASTPNDPRFAAIEARIGGRVGVFALNTADGAVLRHRADERFAMCSTFKWLLAAQMLHLEQQGSGFLAQRIPFSEADLLDYAPVARENLARGWMSVEALCAGAVVLSDNTCANLLLAHASGPAGLTQFLRDHGDAITRLDRIEPEMNVVPPGDDRDTTTPQAMARTAQRLLLTDAALGAASREKLIGWMIESPTGRERLRAGLPADWRAGDKTGTWNGEHNAANDVAVAWPPGGAPIVIASYLSGATAAPAERNAAHAEIARIVVQAWSGM